MAKEMMKILIKGYLQYMDKDLKSSDKRDLKRLRDVEILPAPDSI